VRILAKACAVLLSAAAAALAQPVVSPNGMVNAASSVPAGLPNGDVAQGSIFSIYGNNMGPAAPGVSATSFPLPTSGGLSGVSVQVTDSAATTRYAILLFVYAGQINAVLPSATALGQASLTVTYNRQTSAAQTFNVVARSVGLFTRNAAGSGPGIVQLYHGTEKPTFNDISNSAIPGDAAVLWGTGLGPVTGDETQQPVVPVPLAANAEVWVGGQQVPPSNVAYEGRATFAGEDQINFTVPNISGCYVPVFVKVGNIVSNTVSMSIGASGGTCSDPLTNYTGLNLQSNGLRQGSLTLLRIAEQNQLPPFGTMATDAATGLFDSYNWTQLAASRGIGVSVYGACTVYAFSGILATTADIIAPTYLDAGTLSLVGPAGGSPISITATNKGVYNKLLGGSNGFPAPPYLSPGSYTLTGTGGADVGPFTSTLNLPATFTWTNMDAIASVTRSNGVTVNWTGGAGYLLIRGYSAILTSPDTGAGAMFICLAPASAGAFTVPPNVLLALPASALTPAYPLGGLTVEDVAASTTFTPNPPSGLDLGNFSAAYQYTTTLPYY